MQGRRNAGERFSWTWTILFLGVLWMTGAVPIRAQELGISGRVLDESGQPLAAATLELVAVPTAYEMSRLLVEGRAYPAPTVQTRSAADGRFRLVAPQAGMWTLLAKASGRVTQVFELYPLVRPMALPDVELQPVTWLSVRGLPASARVWVQGWTLRGNPFLDQSWSSAGRVVTVPETGAAASVPVDAAERLRLEAWAPGFAATAVDASGADGSLSLDLQRLQARSIVVKDAQGQPVAGVQVRLGEVGWPAAETDAQGRCSLASPAGVELLWGELLAPDGRRDRVRLAPRQDELASDSELKVLEVVLPPLQQFDGRVLAEGSRQPIAGAWLWFPGREAEVARTGAGGHFRLVTGTLTEGARQSRSLLQAAAGGYLSTRTRPGIPAVAEQGELTLLLVPAVQVRGTVVDAEDRVVPGVRVHASPDMNIQRFRALASDGALTDAQGTFVLQALSPETAYRLWLQAEGYAKASESLVTLEVAAEQPRPTIVLQRGRRVFGWLRDAQEAEPIVGAGVALSKTEAPSRRAMRRRLALMLGQADQGLEALTDAEGRFEFHNVPSDTYDLEADAPGFVATTVPGLQIERGAEDFDLGDTYLDLGMALRGRVVDAAGQPLADVDVSARPSGELAGRRSMFLLRGRAASGEGNGIRTVADGVFEVPDLAPQSKVDLSFHRPGYQSVELPGVEVPPELPLEVVLSPASLVQGRVETDQGEPVETARVLLEPRGAAGSAFRPYFGVSEANGSFVVENVPPGTYQLKIASEGFVPYAGPDVEVEAGRDVDGLVAVLAPGAEIAGRVTDSQGRPVAEAIVALVLEDVGNPMSRGFLNTSQAATDGDGRYLLQGVPTGPASVEATHQDHRRAVADLDVRTGENRLDLTFELGLGISGRIVDDLGTPLAGVRVNVYPTGGGRDFRETISDGAGNFVISGLTDGGYRLTAELEGYTTDERFTPVQLSGSPVSGIEVVLHQGGAIIGTIHGLEFYQLSQLRVSARRRGAGWREGTVNHQGGYRIDSVSAGTWTVTASLSGEGRSVQQDVEVPEGVSEVSLDLEFTLGVEVTGTVVQSGQPMKDAFVELSPSGEDAEERTGGSVSTDYQGRFRLEVSAPGTYNASVRLFRSGVWHREEVEVSQGSDLTIELPSNSLAGQVRDATTREPLADAQVELRSEGEQRRSGNSIITDSAGRFRFESVAAGDWTLAASRNGYAPEQKLVTVASGDAIEDIVLDLGATEGLTLDVLLPSGEPADHVSVAIVDTGNRPSFTGSYSTGEGGRVHVPSAPPGQWNVLVSGHGGATARVQANVPGPPIPVRLPAAGSLEIYIPDLDRGEILQPVEARLLGGDGRLYVALQSYREPRDAWPLRDSRARIDRVPAGTWTVTASTVSGLTWSGTVTITPGGVTQLVL